jgi:protocatechuate 3,4-dioxygenase beta subunit
MMLVLAAVAVAHLAGAEQATPPAATAPSAAPSTARISGIVKSAADDAPLSRARVTAASPALPTPRVAITGADGKYAIADLPAGAYTITATRTGYAPFTYGRGRTGTGTPIAVANGQHVANIDLPLVAGGVIAGRILDEDGSPFAGASVEALAYRYQNGGTTLVSVTTAQTDDRGEFRLFGLPPGGYYVSAADPAFTSVSTPKGVQHYSATYYPGTTFADQARTVTVGGSAPPPRVEFKLQLVPPARVSGQLVAYDARPLLGGAIVLSPFDGEGAPTNALEEPKFFPDGRFSFDGVAPGRYQIRARGQTDAAAAALFAVYSVEVFGVDLDGIRMTLRPGATLDGTLAIESVRGTRRPDFSTLRVRAPFADGNAFGDSLTGTVQPGGAYVVRGIMKGSHRIVVDGLPQAWMIKSIEYRGRDIADLELTVNEREQVHDVRIVITDAASEVSGVVQNPRALPIANTGVLVGSKAPDFWTRTSRRLRVAYTDQEGRWSVAGLPPGEYFAVASPLIDERDLGRRERIQALASIGTPFRVDSDDARPTLTLQVNPRVPAAVR